MKIKPVKKELYLNPIAQQFLLSDKLIKVLIAGRAFGKSFINGIDIMQKIKELPRSRGLFIGATYTQILTNTLLPIKFAWEWLGYYENVHYVIGKVPPKHFVSPYQKPERFENVISFWNGSIVILGSMDRPDLLRGGNNDWSKSDESLLMKKPEYDQIIIPSIRGSHPLFKGMKGHLSESFTSSMPYGSRGTWLLDFEPKSKTENSNVFYIEGTTWHNREVIGDAAILKMREGMLPVIYAIEIMNKRIRQFGNVFYPKLTDRHWYTAENYNYIDNQFHSKGLGKRTCEWDSDHDPKLPIHISHDWGAFNCIWIDQVHEGKRKEVRFINAMHVTHPDTIDDLAHKFCDYYQSHENKFFYQWGDKSGAKREANSKSTYFQQFSLILQKRGWRGMQKKTGDIDHLLRHNFIIKLHEEKDPRLPIIRHNETNCAAARIALESAGMKDMKKDKTSENNPSVKPEHATHYTDAYDYRLYHAFSELIHRT
jgi:hypothetical protein